MSGKWWEMEVVFQPENFRIFSGDLRAFPAGKNGKLVGSLRKKSGDFPTGILLPCFHWFPVFSCWNRPVLLDLGYTYKIIWRKYSIFYLIIQCFSKITYIIQDIGNMSRLSIDSLLLIGNRTSKLSNCFAQCIR